MDWDNNGMQHGEIHVMHWFRTKGLRLHDNPSLKYALKGATTFRCVFILDPWVADSNKVGIAKWRFLLQCLQDLDSRLAKLNSRLFVVKGQPMEVLPELLTTWNITRLSFEEDPEPFGKDRDRTVYNLAKDRGVEVVMETSHTLYNLNGLVQANGGTVPLTFKKFQTYVQKMNLPPRPMSEISPEDIGTATSLIQIDHDEKYGLVNLESLGFDTERLLQHVVWTGGESEAMLRLDRHMERKAWVANFDKPKVYPQSLMSNPTGLAAYLRFGCISPRLFFWRLTDLYRTIKRRHDCPPSLHGQLLWREFFYLVAMNNPRFDRMVGNPICVQIPWDRNPIALAKWANGKTGFPWIDAIMTQLRQEGSIHNLAQHCTIYFLTRGNLWLSWEEGMKVFDELSIDVDWSTNAGYWMWQSCSSFFQLISVGYNPVYFGSKIDPNGDYVRKYLPVLSRYPSEYIYAPWKAPQEVQEAAKCFIGKDYPCPMLNPEETSRINMERIKQVFSHLLNQGSPLSRYARRYQRGLGVQCGEISKNKLREDRTRRYLKRKKFTHEKLLKNCSSSSSLELETDKSTALFGIDGASDALRRAVKYSFHGSPIRPKFF